MRNPGGVAQSISAAELEITLSGGEKLAQTTWVSGQGTGEVLRSGSVMFNKNRGVGR